MHHLVGAVAGCEAVVAHAMVGLLIATVWQAVVALVLAIVVALVLLAVFVALLLSVVVRVDPLPLVCFLFAALPNEALTHDCINS